MGAAASQGCPPGAPKQDTAEPVRGRASEAIDGALSWHLARTGPRLGSLGRKALDESLERMKVPAYRPRTSSVVVRRGRRVVRHVPLLIRTLIIGVRDSAHLGEVQALPGIAEIVCQPAQEEETAGNVAGLVMKPARLDPVRLQEFLDALAKNEIVQPVGIQVGQSVLVVTGPFASFPAIVEEIMPGDRVKVAISIFGRATPAVLGIADVQVV
jgi:transcriptional antiterminator NusG